MCMVSAERPGSLMEALKARRSVRAYSDRGVGRGEVARLLEAAVLAPTAMHEEPWAFSVIQDGALLKKISDRAKPLFVERLHRSGKIAQTFSDQAFDVFHGAGTLVVICARATSPFVEADCWLAAENLMLAACDMGLGTCVIGSALPALDIPEIRAEAGIPPQYRPIAPVVVGYPQGETPATSRKAPVILAWI